MADERFAGFVVQEKSSNSIEALGQAVVAAAAAVMRQVY